MTSHSSKVVSMTFPAGVVRVVFPARVVVTVKVFAALFMRGPAQYKKTHG